MPIEPHRLLKRNRVLIKSDNLPQNFQQEINGNASVESGEGSVLKWEDERPDGKVSFIIYGNLTEEQKWVCERDDILYEVTQDLKDVVVDLPRGKTSIAWEFATAAKKQGNLVHTLVASAPHRKFIATLDGGPTPEQLEMLKESGFKYQIR